MADVSAVGPHDGAFVEVRHEVLDGRQFVPDGGHEVNGDGKALAIADPMEPPAAKPGLFGLAAAQIAFELGDFAAMVGVGALARRQRHGVGGEHALVLRPLAAEGVKQFSATIAAAYVEFHNPQPAWITVGLELAAEAADDSAAFSSSSRPSQRPLTVERVQHNSDLHWQGGDWHALDGISAVLQEVVDRPGWHSGSSLSVILHGTDSPFGRKYVSSYESDPARAPRLVVRLPRPASPCS